MDIETCQAFYNFSSFLTLFCQRSQPCASLSEANVRQRFGQI